MAKDIYSVIVGSGSYIPSRVVSNSDFLNREFFERDGTRASKPNSEIIATLESITGIKERRCVLDSLVTSDIATFSAQSALWDADIDPETLDYIIVAHNFGDVTAKSRQSDFVPAVAARVKHKLGIENPKTIPYDLPFGCPGWLEGVILGNCYIQAGKARRVLVVGAETLSRVADPHDQDFMIFADGAGAVILEAVESDYPVGVLSHATRSDTAIVSKRGGGFLNLSGLIRMGSSNNPTYDKLVMKMDGHDVFEYALEKVPEAMKECLDLAKLSLTGVNKILIHQANDKMDQKILKRLFRSCGIGDIPADMMPMTISQLGNSSVATIPTLYDLIAKGKLPPHVFCPDYVILFASVGASMNINAAAYRVPATYFQ